MHLSQDCINYYATVTPGLRIVTDTAGRLKLLVRGDPFKPYVSVIVRNRIRRDRNSPYQKVIGLNRSRPQFSQFSRSGPLSDKM